MILYDYNMSLDRCICCGEITADKFRGIPMCVKIGLKYIGDFTSTKEEILEKEKIKNEYLSRSGLSQINY